MIPVIGARDCATDISGDIAATARANCPIVKDTVHTSSTKKKYLSASFTKPARKYTIVANTTDLIVSTGKLEIMAAGTYALHNHE